MEADQENVVREQHEAGEFICNFASSEGVVAEIADVFDLGVLHDEFVHRDARNPETDSSDNHSDDAGNPSEYGE
jgi:hypothetical protein